MPGLDPGIHLLAKMMDCRVKPGNDAERLECVKAASCHGVPGRFSVLNGGWRGGESVASVELRSLTKRYGELAVVDDVSLTIEHGRLVCLLGPSGCGKTTTLRLIAGFVEPTAGEI